MKYRDRRKPEAGMPYSKAAFRWTRLNGRAGDRVRYTPRGRTLSIGASKRVQTRKSAPEMWWHCSGLDVLLHSCISMQLAGHSTINLGLHLHAEIGLSNASDIETKLYRRESKTKVYSLYKMHTGNVFIFYHCILPVNTKHLLNIYAMMAQRLRRCSNIV